MAKRKPKAFSIGNLRCRAIRGPRDDGRCYWRAHWWDGSDKSEKLGWATREEAEELALELRKNLDREVAHEVTEIVTVKDLLEVWRGVRAQRKDLSKFTQSNQKSAAKRVTHAIGGVRLDRLSLSTLERYREERQRDGIASGTIKFELRILRQGWDWGRELGACPDRPLPKVGVTVTPTRSRRTPSVEEVQKVIDALDGWPRIAMILLVATGARIGSIGNLKWSDVDLDNGWLNITGKRKSRQVPILPHIIEELRAWRPDDCEPNAYVLGLKPLSAQNNLRQKHLPKAFKKAKVEPFHPHGLRRLAVDTLARAGVDVGTAASITGHSPQTMLAFYRQATQADRRKAIAMAKLGVVPEKKIYEFPNGGSAAPQPIQSTDPEK